MGLFIVSIGIPCIMDVWERHWELSSVENCSRNCWTVQGSLLYAWNVISHACAKKRLCNLPISFYMARP